MEKFCAEMAAIYSKESDHNVQIEKLRHLLHKVLSSFQQDKQQLTEAILRLVEMVVGNECTNIVVSRQFISHIADRIKEGADFHTDLLIAIAGAVLSRLQSRAIAYEEQSAQIRTRFADALERNGQLAQAARTLIGIPLIGQRLRGYRPDFEVGFYLHITELFLEAGSVAKAEQHMKMASLLRQDVREQLALLLKYKSKYARVLDQLGHFVEAAQHYYELSTRPGLSPSDRRHTLQSALTCTLLAPLGIHRSRLLNMLFIDGRCQPLLGHSLLRNMCLERLVQGPELTEFEASLAGHQRLLDAEGASILQRAVLEHNVLAASRLYATISFARLGQLLGIPTAKTEKIAASMIAEGKLRARVEQLDLDMESRICFEAVNSPPNNSSNSSNSSDNEESSTDSTEDSFELFEQQKQDNKKDKRERRMMEKQKQKEAAKLQMQLPKELPAAPLPAFKLHRKNAQAGKRSGEITGILKNVAQIDPSSLPPSTARTNLPMPPAHPNQGQHPFRSQSLQRLFAYGQPPAMNHQQQQQHPQMLRQMQMQNQQQQQVEQRQQQQHQAGGQNSQSSSYINPPGAVLLPTTADQPTQADGLPKTKAQSVAVDSTVKRRAFDSKPTSPLPPAGPPSQSQQSINAIPSPFAQPIPIPPGPQAQLRPPPPPSTASPQKQVDPSWQRLAMEVGADWGSLGQLNFDIGPSHHHFQPDFHADNVDFSEDVDIIGWQQQEVTGRPEMAHIPGRSRMDFHDIQLDENLAPGSFTNPSYVEPSSQQQQPQGMQDIDSDIDRLSYTFSQPAAQQQQQLPADSSAEVTLAVQASVRNRMMGPPFGREAEVTLAVRASMGSLRAEAGTCLGIRTTEGIFLVAEKKVADKPLDAQVMREKIFKVSANVICAVAGIASDANVMIARLREIAAIHKSNFLAEDIPVEQLVQRLRPFGLSFLCAGWDPFHGFQLYQSDPSGNYTGWHATCIGKNHQTAISQLKQEHKSEGMTLEKAKRMAIKVMAKTTDAKLSVTKLEVAELKMVDEKLLMRFLDEPEIQALITEQQLQAEAGGAELAAAKTPARGQR